MIFGGNQVAVSFFCMLRMLLLIVFASPQTQTLFSLRNRLMEDPSFALSTGLPNSPKADIYYCLNKLLQFFKKNLFFHPSFIIHQSGCSKYKMILFLLANSDAACITPMLLTVKSCPPSIPCFFYFWVI